jgi:AcrR family transcriptional regulator
MRDGAERLSTTAVAERAGVSIGSLYQYFANKEDLLIALARREVGEILGAIAAEFALAPPGGRGRGVVRAIVAEVAGRSGGSRANLQLLLRFAGRAEILSQVRDFASGFSGILAGDRELSEEEVFVLTRAVLGVAIAALAEEHALDLRRLEDEIVNLIYRYLDRAERSWKQIPRELGCDETCYGLGAEGLACTDGEGAASIPAGVPADRTNL